MVLQGAKKTLEKVYSPKEACQFKLGPLRCSYANFMPMTALCEVSGPGSLRQLQGGERQPRNETEKVVSPAGIAQLVFAVDREGIEGNSKSTTN